MNCNEFIEKILDHALLEQSVAEPEAASHLAGCPTCRERLEFERRLAAGFATVVGQEPPSELAARVLDIPGRSAAAEAPDTAAEPRNVIAEAPARLPIEAPVVERPRAAAQEPVSREPAWWQTFWFRAGLSFAAAGFLLAVGVSHLMTGESGMADKRTELARSADVQTAPSAVPAPAGSSEPQPGGQPEIPAAPVAVTPPVPEVAAGADTGMQPPAQTMTMAAAPAAPVTPPPPPPVFRVETAAPPEGAEAVSKAAPAPEPVLERPAAQNEIPAVAAVSEEKLETAKNRPPVVVGEPLTGGSKKRSVKPDMQLAAAKPAPTSPKPGDALPEKKVTPAVAASKAFTVRARVPSEAFAESDGVLLRETTTADEREQAADDLTPPSEPGFAPPPPKSFAKSAAPDRDIDLSGAVASPRKQARIEEIMAAHAAVIRGGALDIDQWVLSGWITVKERIDIAPPHGMKWIAVKRGAAWKAELKPVR
ncbi:MAG TPA: hypothetical protein PLP29_09110 [Candidatus Ozemobacteraceae bacterium]|nr:hypothetical protein [Candidatus Ozemobacteraceae bacterium]